MKKRNEFQKIVFVNSSDNHKRKRNQNALIVKLIYLLTNECQTLEQHHIKSTFIFVGKYLLRKKIMHLFLKHND